MEGMNACTQCGYTTTDFSEFALHIERHEKSSIILWSSENTPSTSPRGSTDSGISSSGIPEEELSPETKPDSPETLDSKEDRPPSPSLPTFPSSNMFVSAAATENPFSGLSMVAAAMAAVSGGADKLPHFNTSQAATENNSYATDFPQPTSRASPEDLKSEDREARKNSTKAEKVMHSCPHCNFTTVMSQHMKSHLEAHERHQGQMYQCDICQMQFSQKANMHRHRMRHSGVKPYECRYCFKKFFRKDQMQEHSMTHIKTGDDFDCPVAGCVRQFSQHSALRCHLEEQHIISAAQQASCKRCSLLFSNSRRLLLHYQTKHDEADAAMKRSFKEESGNFTNLANLDLNAAMQLLAGNSPASLTAEKPPPAKKRRLNSSKRAVASQLSTPPSFSSASPQAQFNPMTSFTTENLLPLDMSRKSPSFVNTTSPVMTSNAVSVVQTPKKSPVPDTEDIVVDVCGTDLEKEVKKEARDHSPKLPKAESPNYERLIANNYRFGLRPDLMPLLNSGFNPFFMPTKPEHLMWNPETSGPTTITSISASNHGAEDLSTSTTHSPSAESLSSTVSVEKEPLECNHCGIVFNDRTLHLLHKGLHSAQDPWKCNLCGAMCYDKYVFTSHMISSDHA